MAIGEGNFSTRGKQFQWLILAAISIGTTGVWVMHFIAMLGYTIPGMTIRYNIPITVGSMLLAVAVVSVGLLIVGFGQPTVRNLLLAGVITGVGVASMHYTGMAAMHMHSVPAGTAMPAGGATAEGFLLPLIIGIGVVSVIMTALLVLSPTDDEIREDRELMERINAATARLAAVPQQPSAQAGPSAQWPGTASTWTGSPGGQDGAAGVPGPSGRNGQWRQIDPPEQYGHVGQYGRNDFDGQNGQTGRNDHAAQDGPTHRNSHAARNSQDERNGQDGHNGDGRRNGEDSRNGRDRPRRRSRRPGAASDPDRQLSRPKQRISPATRSRPWASGGAAGLPERAGGPQRRRWDDRAGQRLATADLPGTLRADQAPGARLAG